MKAVLVLGPGGPERVVVREVSTPEPRDGQVLVRVRAASVNPLDWKLRRSALRFLYGLKFPFIPGFDFAGVVETVGSNVHGLKEGDEVYGGTTAGGCHAQCVVVDEAGVAPKPTSVTLIEAAAVPGAGLTALQALRDRANIQPGASVLINGASGGVGSFAVQIAVALGGKVTAVTSGRNVEFVRTLGAERVIDYTRDSFTSLQQRFDVIFDVVTNRSFSQCAPLLTSQGIYLTTLPGPGPFLWRLVTQIARPFGYRKRCWWVMMKPNREGLENLAELVDSGRLRPPIGQTFSLEEAPTAHRLSELGHTRGKTVIVLDEPPPVR